MGVYKFELHFVCFGGLVLFEPGFFYIAQVVSKETSCIDQAGLQFIEFPASASQVLRLKARTTTLSLILILNQSEITWAP